MIKACYQTVKALLCGLDYIPMVIIASPFLYPTDENECLVINITITFIWRAL